MNLETSTADRYVRLAFGQMLEVARRLGDDQVNIRPHGPTTNTVAGLITHCCGVSEYWLGHVGLGRPSDRERDGEFTRKATVAMLEAAVEATTRQITADLPAIERGAQSEFAEGRQFLVDRDRSDASLVMHVIEELFQHLGHIDLTADALLNP